MDLNFKPAKMPETVRGGRKPEDNPFLAPLEKSYNDGNAIKVTVPEDKAKWAANKVRRAAETLGIGARVHLEDPKAGKVDLFFQGQPKRKHVRKAKQDNAAETEAA